MDYTDLGMDFTPEARESFWRIL